MQMIKQNINMLCHGNTSRRLSENRAFDADGSKRRCIGSSPFSGKHVRNQASKQTKGQVYFTYTDIPHLFYFVNFVVEILHRSWLRKWISILLPVFI